MWLHVALQFYISFFVVVDSDTASRELSELQADFFAWQMEQHPSSATYRGVHKYDDQLESFNTTSWDQRVLRVEELYNRLSLINTTKLDWKGLVNFRILDDMMATYLHGYHWSRYQHLGPVTFLEGPQTFVEANIQGLPFFTRGDFENYLVRLGKTPRQYEEFKWLMQEGIRLNRTYHNHSLSRLEDQFTALLAVPVNESAFYQPFVTNLELISVEEEDRQSLRDRGLTASRNVRSALEDLWHFIQTEYLPNTRPEIGINSLDGGLQFYEACIHWYLSLNMTARQVHNVGLDEVKRITSKMHQVMARQGFNGSIGDYFRVLKNDSSFFYSTTEELLEGYREQIFTVIDPQMDKYFDNIPRLPLEVRALKTDGPGGYYSVGSADGTRPGVFWLNTFRLTDHPNFTMMALTVHETIPGHHLQSSVEILSDAPDFRQKKLSGSLYRVPFNFPRYTAAVEGWALYAEYLGEEMALYRDDYELMGRYSAEMFRACRLVIDTGIHAFNWSREEAIGYMLLYTAESPEAAAVEVDRYITWPGQALAYKIGELKIKQLRSIAETQLGGRFDLRAFHSLVLETGAVPLKVLEEVVTDWINSFPFTTPGPEMTTVGMTCRGTCLAASWLLSIFCLLPCSAELRLP